MGTLNKAELIKENKKLKAKIRNLEDPAFFDDNLSSEENLNEDADFVPKSPNNTKRKSLLSSESSEISNIVQSLEQMEECGSETSDSESSEKEILKKKQESKYRKLAFMKLCQGPKRFYSGVKLDCSFQSKDMDSDQESLKVLNNILNQKKKKITTKLQLPFPGKELDFSQKSQEYPCPMKNCTFHGKKLKCHLLSKTHKCSEENAHSYESFIRTYLSYTTLTVKHKASKRHMCHLCKSFFE